MPTVGVTATNSKNKRPPTPFKYLSTPVIKFLFTGFCTLISFAIVINEVYIRLLTCFNAGGNTALRKHKPHRHSITAVRRDGDMALPFPVSRLIRIERKSLETYPAEQHAPWNDLCNRIAPDKLDKAIEQHCAEKIQQGDVTE